MLGPKRQWIWKKRKSLRRAQSSFAFSRNLHFSSCARTLYIWKVFTCIWCSLIYEYPFAKVSFVPGINISSHLHDNIRLSLLDLLLCALNLCLSLSHSLGFSECNMYREAHEDKATGAKEENKISRRDIYTRPDRARTKAQKALYPSCATRPRLTSL